MKELLELKMALEQAFKEQEEELNVANQKVTLLEQHFQENAGKD